MCADGVGARGTSSQRMTDEDCTISARLRAAVKGIIPVHRSAIARVHNATVFMFDTLIFQFNSAVRRVRVPALCPATELHSPHTKNYVC